MSRSRLKNYRGTYRFKLLATADNAERVAYRIDITYDGDWHNLRAIGQRVIVVIRIQSPSLPTSSPEIRLPWVCRRWLFVRLFAPSALQ